MRLPRVPEECSQETCDLMLQCLKEDPEARPSAKELMRALGEERRRTNQAAGCGPCSREAPGRPAGVAVHAPPPPAAASPFANGSPPAAAPPAASGAPAAAASPFANAASAAGAPHAAAASPFANAVPAAGTSHAAVASLYTSLSAVPEDPSPAKDASAALSVTPHVGGLAAADNSPFVFADGVAGVAAAPHAAAEQPPAAQHSPRPLLADQSYIALGSAFNHASPAPSSSLP